MVSCASSATSRACADWTVGYAWRAAVSICIILKRTRITAMIIRVQEETATFAFTANTIIIAIQAILRTWRTRRWTSCRISALWASSTWSCTTIWVLSCRASEALSGSATSGIFSCRTNRAWRSYRIKDVASNTWGTCYLICAGLTIIYTIWARSWGLCWVSTRKTRLAYSVGLISICCTWCTSLSTWWINVTCYACLTRNRVWTWYAIKTNCTLITIRSLPSCNTR
jgi:hypothetical protein